MMAPEWEKFEQLVEKHTRRVDCEFDELHDGWLYCWCDDAAAIRAAAKTLHIPTGQIAINDELEGQYTP